MGPAHGGRRAEPFDAGHVKRTFGRAFWALSLPVAILGGIFVALSVVGALFLRVLLRD